MIEQYKGYQLKSNIKLDRHQKWTVSVIISREFLGIEKKILFQLPDTTNLILEIEAANESINLGKNLIDKNLIGF